MKTCISCKNEFESKRADAKFCSDKCRKALSRTNKSDKSLEVSEINVRDNNKLKTNAFPDLGAEELYDAIRGYEQDTWKDSPEHKELMWRLNNNPVDVLKAHNYFIPARLIKKPT